MGYHWHSNKALYRRSHSYLGNGQVQIRAKYFVTDNIYLYPDMFGKTVFLTCAEAEATIEARKGGKE